jgi:ABC-type lipoprotein release transport system permease subunit
MAMPAMTVIMVVIMMMAMLVIIHAKGTLGADNQHAIGILRTEIAFG